jgi:protein SCO1/2
MKLSGFKKILENLNCPGALLVAVIIGGNPAFAAPATADQIEHSYSAHGIVRQISSDRRAATIQHEAIPGYMGAMTMDFPVQDTNELAGISPNDEITFKLVVTTNADWIEGVRFVSHHVTEITNNVFVFHAASDELKPGDALPDGELTAEDGRKIRFSDFHGRALAFTFFYTSCPLPDYCPKMNRNFAEARKILLADTNAPGNWELLSVSFDTTIDQPPVLSGYANFYRGADTNHWLFAVATTNTLAELAPRVGLMVMRQDANISHNLRTIVLDPAGRISRQFNGNDWTPQQLADAICAAARGQAKPGL